MLNKVMIITYNDAGNWVVKNYSGGEISVKQKERAVTDKDGHILATIPTRQNIKMKKMKEREITSEDLIDIINYLEILKNRCAAKEISNIIEGD